jgi:phosphate-selective porin OprO/OprP
MRTSSWLTVGGFWLVIAGAQAEDGPTPPVGGEEAPAGARADERPAAESTTESIEKRLEDLEQELRILRRQAEIEREERDARAKDAPVFTAGREGFALKSADGAFQLKLRGYLHADSRWFLDEGDVNLDDTFLLRRARPIFEGTLFEIFDYRIMPDFGGGTASIQDGYLNARFLPEIKVQAGKFKTPFGLERLQSATDIRFVERGLPNNLVPNRDIGAMLHGDLLAGRLAYAAGIFNGVADGGSSDLDLHDGKDLAARLFAHPFKGSGEEWLESLGIGVAGTFGNQENTLPTYRSTGQASIFTYRATVLADGDHSRLSPQAYYYQGPFGLLLEYVHSAQEVELGATEDVIRNQAWQAAASWLLTGEAASYRSPTPKKPFNLKSGDWGAFEVVARVSWLGIDGDAFPVFANPATAVRRALAWGGGINWYLNTNVKAVLNFERTTYDGGSASGNRDAENAILTRIQFAF